MSDELRGRRRVYPLELALAQLLDRDLQQLHRREHPDVTTSPAAQLAGSVRRA